MESQTTVQAKRQKLVNFSKQLLILTIAGGVVFWLTTIATSVLPIAARYRAAFSNWSVQTVWVASLPMGLLIGWGVSYFCIKLAVKDPVKSPLLVAVLLSSAALVIATILVDVPMLLRAANASAKYFYVGIVFNAVRFLLLGMTVGYLYPRLH